MVFKSHIVLGILIVQLYVNAAPSDVGKLEDIAKEDQVHSDLDTGPLEVEDKQNSTETSRQKRYYNPFGFGFPPFNPLIYPDPNIRDFGVEDPLYQIHRRVQDIANIVRQPPPPPIPQVPIFLPILLVPPFDCRCDTTNLQPTEPNPNDNNTSPNVTTRFPETEDERQNWGIVVNDTAQNIDDDGQDFSRPISFDPIRLKRPNERPPPPVNHGTLQGEAADNQQPQTGENNPLTPPNNSTESPRPLNTPPPPQPFYPQNGFDSTSPMPCDGAILTCCHRPVVTYECFAVQGCPNFTYGNPCNYTTILRVIEKFQRFYGTRS